MFAATRARGVSAAPSTRRRFAEADHLASASSAPILDTDEQTKVVQSLERQASNAAKTWRFAFGFAASLGALFFVRLAALATAHDHAAKRDVAWSQPAHIHAYHENASLSAVRALDVATAVALASAAAATALLLHDTGKGGHKGDKNKNRICHAFRRNAKTFVFLFACVLGALAARGWARAFADAAEATERDARDAYLLAFFFPPRREAWVPAVALFGAPTCFAIDRSLERTVREARALRRLVYRHRRA